MQIHSVGIDLGKTTFHLVALSAAGKVLLRKKFTQKQLITFTANMQPSLIGMEACSGAHFLGRVLRGQGHDVKLIPVREAVREVQQKTTSSMPRRSPKLSTGRTCASFRSRPTTNWTCKPSTACGIGSSRVARP
jgi:hypothetical protein